LAFLLIVALILFFVARARSLKSRINISKTPPNFANLAYVLPAIVPLQSAKSEQWKLFELFIATSAPLKLAFLGSAPSMEFDNMVKYMIYVTNGQNLAPTFVNDLITEDIRQKKLTNTLESSTLFRENSAASIAFRHLAMIKGLPFLFFTVGSALDEFFEKEIIKAAQSKEGRDGRHSMERGRQSMERSEKSNPVEEKQTHNRGSMNRGSQLELTPISVHSNSLVDNNFELDSSKMGEADDGQVNSLALQIQCQKILVSLFRSPDLFPVELKMVLAHLSNEVSRNLTVNDGFVSVGGFVFLRFVNPSILFPTKYGLIEEMPDSPSGKRQLILVTKVLQNLANGVRFGQKESFMLPLNDFLESNQQPYKKYLQQVATAPARNGTVSDMTVEMQVVEDPKKNEPSKAKSDVNRINALKPESKKEVVDTSLGMLYNHMYYHRDEIFAGLKSRVTDDQFVQFQVKIDSIILEIGEPISNK